MKLKPEVKTAWLEALRSGEYKQQTGALRKYDGFCCKGVLADLFIRSVKQGHWDIQDGRGIVPLTGIKGTPNLEYESYLPNAVYVWAFQDFVPGSLNCTVGPRAKSGDSLARLNDSGSTFSQIADIIEKEF